MNHRIVRLSSGEEILCDLLVTGDSYLLKEPAIIIPAGDGNIGLAHWLPYADNKVVNTDRVPLLKAFRDEAKALNKPTPVLNDLLVTIPEGVPNGGYTKARGNFFSRYQFSEGALKGFAFGGGMNWRLRTYRGTVAIATANSTPTDLWSPAYSLYNAYFSYARKVLNRNTTFQLNVDNLLNKEYYRSAAVGSGSWGDPRTFRFTMSTEL